MLGAASSTAAEGGVALTERHYKEAADLFGQAARRSPERIQERTRRLSRCAQGQALYRQGDELGDNVALSERIEVYRAALTERTREQIPLDWATTQNDLGIALRMLGERESRTDATRGGNRGLSLGAGGTTRERVPLDWAMTQNDLGNALEMLGEWESRTARLEEAVVAFRRRSRSARASGFCSIGRRRRTISASRFGGLASGRAGRRGWRPPSRPIARRLRSARASGFRSNGRERRKSRRRARDGWRAREQYRESSKRRSRPIGGAGRTDPRSRSARLGGHAEQSWQLLLEALGERESRTARLEEAVAAYGAAMEEHTRERAPLDWAASFGSQGVAMMLIADRTNDAAMAETAVRKSRPPMRLCATAATHDGRPIFRRN